MVRERGVNVTKLILSALALSATILPGAAFAQEPPPATPPATPPAAQVPATPPAPAAKTEPPPVAAAAPLDAETYKHRRGQIEIMEGVLMGAVKGAAQEMAQRMTSLETPGFVPSGSLSAKGFILEGYGVFFHIEIPGVQPIVTIESMQAARERLSRPRQPQPEAANSGVVQTPRGTAETDPGSNAEYVELVTQRLMEAMIRYSTALELQPNEWFTVAAGDGDNPLPGLLVPRSTMILRVKGSDIADYMTKRATLEEIRRKIEVRKF